MTTSYDPRDHRYTDEHDVRTEMGRVFDICIGCRQCASLCPTFSTLFSKIESKGTNDAGRFTPHEQDEIANQCFRCSLCSTMCPYTPNEHQFGVDFPRLIDRHRAMQKKNRHWSIRSSIGHFLLSRLWLAHRFFSRFHTGGVWRRIIARMTSVSATFIFVRRTPMRLSAWLGLRTSTVSQSLSRVAVFPTCVVEHVQPQIGQALIEVYEHNNIACSLIGSDVCCGASHLLHGDMKTFLETATRNVELMAETVRDGVAIVVPNPTCYSVITSDYPHYVGTDDAELVAKNVFEASEYLVHQSGERSIGIDTNFSGIIPHSITHHVPMEMYARDIGASGRDVMSLTGAEMVEVAMNSGAHILWGAHTDFESVADTLGHELGVAIGRVRGDVVISDCPWSFGQLDERLSIKTQHPMEILAQAYGIGAPPIAHD